MDILFWVYTEVIRWSDNKYLLRQAFSLAVRYLFPMWPQSSVPGFYTWFQLPANDIVEGTGMDQAAGFLPHMDENWFVFLASGFPVLALTSVWGSQQVEGEISLLIRLSPKHKVACVWSTCTFSDTYSDIYPYTLVFIIYAAIHLLICFYFPNFEESFKILLPL